MSGFRRITRIVRPTPDPLNHYRYIAVSGFGRIMEYTTPDLMTLGEVIAKQDELEMALRLELRRELDDSDLHAAHPTVSEPTLSGQDSSPQER